MKTIVAIVLNLCIVLSITFAQSTPPAPESSSPGRSSTNLKNENTNGQDVNSSQNTSTNLSFLAKKAQRNKRSGGGWALSQKQGQQNQQDSDKGVILTNNWIVMTNDSIATGYGQSSKKKKTYSYKKECPECNKVLTSNKYTSWIVKDGKGNDKRIIQVVFHCDDCGDTFTEIIEKPMRKTSVEEITSEVVK